MDMIGVPKSVKILIQLSKTNRPLNRGHYSQHGRRTVNLQSKTETRENTLKRAGREDP